MTTQIPIFQRMNQGILLWDGAMGTQVHKLDLDIERDYQGCENCTDILSLSCPDEIAEIHRAYFESGCDVVTTNTFGAARHVLDEFERGSDARELSRKAAQIAKGVADEFTNVDQPRYVAGSLGPGTKLCTLGQINFEHLRDSYAEAAIGLIEGGSDLILIETCQDLLQVKGCVQAVHQAAHALGRDPDDIPIFVSVTIEQTGTMLVGSSIEAAIETLRRLPIAALGLNCATGPVEMMNHVRTLASKWDRLITVMPNAGLPVLEAGETVYPLDPDGFVKAVQPLLDEGLVDAVGGCCGTSPAHIALMRTMIDDHAKVERVDAQYAPSCSSLYNAVEFRQDQSFLIVGERCNSSGSRLFKRLLEEEDFDGIVSLARQQIRDGSHVLDINVDVAGRDNARDMHEVVSRIVRQVDAPLMLDSTSPEVIRAGLMSAPGKCIINSANFEEGEEKFDELCVLAKDFGAALVIGTIDEDIESAMARTADRKLEIAARAIERATTVHGLVISDLFIDPLVLPISTGMDSDRRSGSELIEGTRRIAESFPDVQLTCGLSNVSFGLKPVARVVINAVLLDELVRSGMSSAIVHASKITPLHKIPDEQKNAAMDLIMDRRSTGAGGTGLPDGITDEGHDPLSQLIDLFMDESEQVSVEDNTDRTLEERLRIHIIDGEHQGLDETINEALESYSALEIINNHLLEGMKTVGELFGSGQMQLPFVLQSAEVMKKSVALLEPHMEKADSVSKGSIVLATVKGDVHDIGKNLVDILLTNNGFTVHNLGIKQPIDSILKAFRETNADAIGLSGLLVKSVNVMEENLNQLNESEIKVPVLLGGAALTRTYAEGHLSSVYKGDLHYAKDAFDGLDTMNAIVAGTSTELITAAQERQSRWNETRSQHAASTQQQAESASGSQVATLTRSEVTRSNEIPTPPFWGTRVVDDIPLQHIFPYINPTALFSVQWQIKRGSLSKQEYSALLDEVARPKLEELKSACVETDILNPGVVYGYFPCSSDGNALIVFDPEDHDREVERFEFPRQSENHVLCISDYYRDVDECRAMGRRDVISMMCVTMGQQITEHTKVLFDSNQYKDYLYWHGIGVEAAEGLAELWHKRVRQELGFGHEDSSEIPKLFQQKYRGSRYSFGYPACPEMSDHLAMWRLLDPLRIGCSLTENYQIDPEQSTCAIISHHPQARYFNA